jgi:hypothetical protein
MKIAVVAAPTSEPVPDSIPAQAVADAALWRRCVEETLGDQAIPAGIQGFDIEWDQDPFDRTARADQATNGHDTADQPSPPPFVHDDAWHLARGYVLNDRGEWVFELELRVSLARKEAIQAYNLYRLTPEYQPNPAAHARTQRRRHRHQTTWVG